MKENKIPKFASQQFARALRKNHTPKENRLWFHLRDRHFASFKFRRQQIMGKYIVDFVCPPKKLIIEADGSHHDVDQDGPRDAYLRSLGYRVMRFNNFDIQRNLDFVLDNIWEALNNLKFNPGVNSPSPAPSGHPERIAFSPAGRGEIGAAS